MNGLSHGKAHRNQEMKNEKALCTHMFHLLCHLSAIFQYKTAIPFEEGTHAQLREPSFTFILECLLNVLLFSH